ncbi:hypothetical protein BC830DRAFT_62003 [Chytriomyces sp. MP71]|nr:hypothetical protein BC830DRAFT_62003 [Chytriomyces sp. MP71]
MLQFQRSIAASVVSSILSVRLQPASPSSSGHTPTPSELANLKLRAMARMIESIVGVVFLLFYIYRDLNGTFAILQGLSDPRLARLSKLWDLVAVKCKDALANLNDVELNHLKTEYTIDDTFASPTNLPILSDIGTQALDELINVLLLCQGRNTGNPDSILDIPPPLPNNPPPHANPPSSTFTPLHLAFDMSELAIGAASATQQFYGAPDMGASQPAPWDVPPASPILDDLAGLPQGDLRCLHWVLTRVAAALVAAAGNATPIAGLAQQVSEEDEALRELENDAWSVAGVGTGELGDDRDPALDEEEYQTRFKALEALFPKSPSGKPMND